MDDMRIRVRKLKDEQGITFKFIAEQCDIDYGAFRNFISNNHRKLSLENCDRLESFLRERGL